jgi:anhydro-N-acetylmuramic acid kinase
MLYRAIGVMSGSSLDGLDIVFAEFQEEGSKWGYTIKAAECYPYSKQWMEMLKNSIHLSAREYQLLHTDYGHYIGQEINRFIESHKLQYQVGLVSSHGHTSFHMPERKMTAQLGDGASIASEVKLPVVTELRSMDLAFGGHGAPIVPIGEKHLLGDYHYFLNLGGIANISYNDPSHYLAFDVCSANRLLNMIVSSTGKEFDEGGKIAANGKLNEELLGQLNSLDYYKLPYPKSLANDFGTDTVYPIVESFHLKVEDALRTYTEHIALQIAGAIDLLGKNISNAKLLATGGGAFNDFLIQRISTLLKEKNIGVVVPDSQLINFKEALVMAFIGILRWRQEYNVLSSVTGAGRDTINGALWMGEEA